MCIRDSSKAIGAYAAKYNYGIVRDLVGHGIGTHPVSYTHLDVYKRQSEGWPR